MLCFVVDYGLYVLLNNYLTANVPSLNAAIAFLPVRVISHIAVAAVTARLVSSVINFFLNQQYVFASRTGGKGAFARYVCTVILVVCLSACGVFLLAGTLATAHHSIKRQGGQAAGGDGAAAVLSARALAGLRDAGGRSGGCAVLGFGVG